MIRANRGFSLIEVMVVVAIQAVIVMAGITIFQNQMKNNNYIEFKSDQNSLKNVIETQWLNDPNNCKCFFQAAGARDFPANSPMTIPELEVAQQPTELGPYKSTAVPFSCAGATVPQIFASNAGIRGFNATSFKIKNIVWTGSTYTAQFSVDVSTSKPVLGPSTSTIQSQVVLNTLPNGPSRVKFDSCSTHATSGANALVLTPTWQSIALGSRGGGGSSAGAPYVNLGSLGDYGCGPLATVTLAEPSLTMSSSAATVTFYSADGIEHHPAIRIFTMGNNLVGLLGDTGRGGDGRSYGLGGDMIIPLTNKQFRMQLCRKNDSAVINFATRTVFN